MSSSSEKWKGNSEVCLKPSLKKNNTWRQKRGKADGNQRSPVLWRPRGYFKKDRETKSWLFPANHIRSKSSCSFCFHSSCLLRLEGSASFFTHFPSALFPQTKLHLHTLFPYPSFRQVNSVTLETRRWKLETCKKEGPWNTESLLGEGPVRSISFRFYKEKQVYVMFELLYTLVFVFHNS